MPSHLLQCRRKQIKVNTECAVLLSEDYFIKITEDVELIFMSVSSLPLAHGHIGR